MLELGKFHLVSLVSLNYLRVSDVAAGIRGERWGHHGKSAPGATSCVFTCEPPGLGAGSPQGQTDIVPFRSAQQGQAPWLPSWESLRT